ncbi:DUF4365 domain-containing protein [Brevifollis gellanilyticus]|uniref:DUF4365 domain-containing protein n=1 Tax=Brevifollis gellanilyticus TaxID=748831 RepID=A0A512M3I0_9BACT|nr:DUF4365 domain-containing protein [Brevifollis gellanilyticus]GEP41282.1 hypothetical protein BGE01nite_05730 [Brevifollis gellanilyticus]
MNRVAAHISEDISRAKAHEFFSRLGWVANDLHRDYGEDMMVSVFRDGFATPTHFFVQLKATQDINRLYRAKRNGFAVSLDCGLVTKWLSSSVATMLLLYDQENDLFYWDYVQYVMRTGAPKSQKTVSVTIKRDRLLTSDSASEMAGYAEHRLQGYQRVVRAGEELRRILFEDYGIASDLDLDSEIIRLPCGRFDPESSGDSQLYFFGEFCDLIDKVNPDGKWPVSDDYFGQLLRNSVLMSLEFAKGVALTLPDPITGKLTVFESDEAFHDRMRRNGEIPVRNTIRIIEARRIAL